VIQLQGRPQSSPHSRCLPYKQYDGVTRAHGLRPNQKNVSHVFGTSTHGKITYRLQPWNGAAPARVSPTVQLVPLLPTSSSGRASGNRRATGAVCAGGEEGWTMPGRTGPTYPRADNIVFVWAEAAGGRRVAGVRRNGTRAAKGRRGTAACRERSELGSCVNCARSCAMMTRAGDCGAGIAMQATCDNWRFKSLCPGPHQQRQGADLPTFHGFPLAQYAGRPRCGCLWAAEFEASNPERLRDVLPRGMSFCVAFCPRANRAVDKECKQASSTFTSHLSLHPACKAALASGKSHSTAWFL